ncbi:MAG: ABC transporter permease [Verrucomicrobia bacterium]|nr:ABC transporter permease [Verrucomicrobiota bacterium]
MKHLLRQLAKSPGYTALALGALALGIGANTVLFSAINTLFLRPLAYPQPDRLVRVFSSFAEKGLEQTAVSWPRYTAFRDQAEAFSALAAQSFTGFTLTGRGDPEQVQARRVTASFFTVLGVKPLLGRAFTVAEDNPGGGNVAVLNHGYWQKRFGGDPAIIGQTLNLDGRVTTIVGVLPPLGSPFDQNQVWVPRPQEQEGLPQELIDRGSGYLNVIGRLKPGVTAAQAADQLRVVHSRYSQAFSDKVDAKCGLSVISLQEDVVGNSRPMFMMLLAAVGCVLLVACFNVANLLLARFAARRKEIAIRSALGASRRRIVVQFLGESVFLAVVAGAIGVLLAIWGLDLLARAGADFIPRANELHLDVRVLAFAGALSLLTGLLLGVFPAIQASRTDPNESLKDATRGSTGGRHAGVFRSTLFVLEIALSLVVLVCAALLIDSFRRLQHVDPGFRAENLTVFNLALPEGQYPTTERQGIFFEQALEKIRAIPGVTLASASNGLPIVGGGARSPAAVMGQALPPMQERAIVARTTTHPGYFATLGVKIKQGRDFTARDRTDKPNVVIINESFAQRLFHGANPVGRSLITGIASIPREIVGVVADYRGVSLSEPPTDQMYYPSLQLDGQFLTVVVQSPRPTASLRAELNQAVHSLDAGLPLGDIQPFTQQLADAIADRRLVMLMLGAFALLSLILAGMGIYSVIAYGVAQRTQEFGIRLALGAQPHEVVAMVVREGLKLALIGLGVGLLIAFFLTRLIQSLLFEVNATDPIVFILVAAFLAVIAALACYLPARRATKVDPMTALRAE